MPFTIQQMRHWVMIFGYMSKKEYPWVESYLKEPERCSLRPFKTTNQKQLKTIIACAKMANVSVVTFPLGPAGCTPLSNLVKIFSKLANEVYIISGGILPKDLDQNVQVIKVNHRTSSRIFMRIINHVHTQLKILVRIVVISKKVDLFVFFIGGEGLLIPIIALKLMGKNVVLMPGGLSTEVYAIKNDPFSKLLGFVTKMSMIAADRVVIKSEELITKWKLEKHRAKISTGYEYFIDCNIFRVRKPLGMRENLVGYIGRLSEEKGVINFVRAIPEVLRRNANVRFLIGGDGPLLPEIKKYLSKRSWREKVNVTGWIPHEELPCYLNTLKLLVVPSYTESGPLIALESMACGTPVLSTNVGIMPDVIDHGKNSFLMKGNDPYCIADNILEVIERSDLHEVSVKARKSIEAKFTFEAAIKKWEEILTNIRGSIRDEIHSESFI
jgi:glycosyltransferase involved in cell wall biosynthesis